MPSLKRFDKQPGERLDFDVDYEDFFGSEDDDDIDGSGQISASVSMADGTAMGSVPPNLQTDGVVAIGGTSARRAKVWLKGGVNGLVYKVTVTANTHQGRIVETDFLLRIKEL